MKDGKPDVLSGREHFLISKALFTAVKALRAQQHPPESDINGMNDLLDRYYPTHKEMYEAQSDLQLALRAGYKRNQGLSHDEDVKRWLKENLPGRMRNVIDIRTPLSKHEPTADDN